MSLTHVQQTLFFPLLGRAVAARRWPEVFADPWAEEAVRIRSAEGSAAVELGDFPAAVYGLRHLGGIVEVNRYLREHPGAAVVNIGCGLDRIVHELDDPGAVVYNLDFPEVLEMRARWAEPSPREVDLPCSVTDHSWMDRVDASRGLIAVASGVFYFLEVEEVRALVHAMAERFPGGRLCYDSQSPEVMAESERQVRCSGTPETRMPFRVADPRSVATWSERIADVRIEYDFTAYSERRAALPAELRAQFDEMGRTESMYEVVVTFAGSP